MANTLGIELGPLAPWLKHCGPWMPVLGCLFAMLVRWAVALNPYSGHGSPPMFGDYEAQRHWMEITIHLPWKQWYRYDLDWWGLDYPPLTAFHSWICGTIGSWISPDWFALDSSRGFESPESKTFMRATVFVSEALIYVPAIFVFCRIQFKTKGSFTEAMTSSLMLLQPALIMIDHGHFQFNSVMLGLTLWAVNCMLTGHYILASVFFCLSLGFKQMALYYAPAIFCFLLGQCFQRPLQRGVLLFFQLGITVLTTFAILLWPWLWSLEDIGQVLYRVFPVARGLYEDKVANVWCAINVVFKLKNMLSVTSALRLSLLTTIIVILPINVHLAFKPTATRFIYALINTSLAFFLFSFQVHEKSILLPALPVTLIMFQEPIAASMFMDVAMFSMYPLLKREGLCIAYFATTILWQWAFGAYSRQTLLQKAMHGIFIAWYIAEMTVAPPPRWPDLYLVLNAVLSCGMFGLLFIYFVYRQWQDGAALDPKLKSQ